MPPKKEIFSWKLTDIKGTQFKLKKKNKTVDTFFLSHLFHNTNIRNYLASILRISNFNIWINNNWIIGEENHKPSHNIRF